MKWAIPPEIKIYEALGCIGDKRIEIEKNNGKVYSSSKGKYYTISFNGTNAIMCNDNGSYWVGYLGYPAIAFLMLKGKIKWSNKLAEGLKDIPWKDINVKLKNDYKKTEEYVLKILQERGFQKSEVLVEIKSTFEEVKKLEMQLLGEKMQPPSGY